MFRNFFKKKASAEEQAAKVNEAAMLARDAFDQQARIERAVSLYGRKVDKTMSMTDAFKVIADCLEQGAASFNQKPQKLRK